MDTLLEPFQYEFFRHGMIAALMVGALCGIMGVYIILRGMSYIGHGLSHAAFGGAVIGYIINLNFYVSAGAVGFLAALLINQVSKKKKIKEDAAIGIVTTSCFALGVAIMSRVRSFTKSFEAALFGNILGVTGDDLIVIAIVTVTTMTIIFFMYKQFLFSTFDNEAARVFGIKTEQVQVVFSFILAASIIASMNIIGVTMIAATLVIPAITARIITDSFSRMMIYSTIIGAITGVVGMYLSYHFNAASGATIVLFGATIFCVVLLVTYLKEKFTHHDHTHAHGETTHDHHHDHAASIHEHAHAADTEKTPPEPLKT